MERRIVQDIIPTPKRSIRNIPLPASREREHEREKREEKREEEIAVHEVRERFEHRNPHDRKSSRKYFIIGGIIIVAIALYFCADAFAHATVSVVLGSESDSVHGSFTTKVSASSSAGITDSAISITKKSQTTITATTTQDVETKATGSIIIFNDYSTAPQKLVTNTRFETSSGLIYRIGQSVSVPGKTTKAGVTTPGSVVVSVTADQVGDKYNIGLSDFTVPGFTGEPQFDGIFARSETPMTGGFSGTEPVVSGTERSAAIGNIDSTLASELSNAAQASVPAGYILYPNAYRIDYSALPDTIGSGNQVTINGQATLTGFALSENDIASALAMTVVKGYADEPITVANLGSIAFSTGAVPTATSAAMSFVLSGTAKFVWDIDPNVFASQLAGKPKGDFTTILQGYPHVTKADVSFFPFWLGSFPSDQNAITIATSTAI